MFRKPREAAAPIASETRLLPSTGRPPTPPSSTQQRMEEEAASTKYSMATSTPLIGRTKALPKRTPTTNAGKVKGKPNGNITNFFKKAESSNKMVGIEGKEEHDSLFLEESPVKGNVGLAIQTPTPPREDSSVEGSPQDDEIALVGSPTSRYNEDPVPSKRRRIEETPKQSPPVEEVNTAPSRGPFVDDSDSEDEIFKVSPSPDIFEGPVNFGENLAVAEDDAPPSSIHPPRRDSNVSSMPQLKLETTSVGSIDEFDGIEDFIDDEFPEGGEEYLERRWMEEQGQFEMGLEDEEIDHGSGYGITDVKEVDRAVINTVSNSNGSTCPICGGNTTGMSDQVGHSLRCWCAT